MHVLLHAARGPCCHWLPSCSQARAHGWALPLPLGISLGRAWDADWASCLKKSSADSETPRAKQCPSCHSVLVLQRHPSGWGMQSQVKWAPQLWKAFHLGFSFPRAKWSATVGTPARSMKSWLVMATMSAWTEFLTGEKILGTEVWLYFTRMPAKKPQTLNITSRWRDEACRLGVYLLSKQKYQIQGTSPTYSQGFSSQHRKVCVQHSNHHSYQADTWFCGSEDGGVS